MALGKASVVSDDSVFALTKKGERELRGGESSLPPEEIEVLVLTDGRATVAKVRGRLPSLAPDVVAAACDKLLRGGWIEPATGANAVGSDALEFFSTKSPLKPSAKALSKAGPEATAGVTTLQRHGYYVSIARRSAPRSADGATLCVVVVEDEPHLQKFLRHYFELDGFSVRSAANRAEIVAAFRHATPPDLVLLDVMLPDADGFDVLLKMRGHSVLKDVPVIMLTAKATREAVLKGLACGANGYITKPFDADTLGRAVRSVLGMPRDPKLEKSRTDPLSGT